MVQILIKMKRLCDEMMLKDPPGPEIYCNATWDGAMCWDFTSAGTLAKLHCPDYIGGNGFAIRECLPNGLWKPNLAETNTTEGWTDYSGCLSTRTQAPAKEHSHHYSRIQLISQIGYSISLAALIVAVSIMIMCKRLHCKSNILHINLFLAFILRASVVLVISLVFVDGLGLEKDITHNPGGTIEFRPEGLHWECKLIMCIFVYTVAASMMWILMEGLYLQILVYKTLFTERHGVRLYVLFGWLSPFVYIIPWIVVRIIEKNELCWNSHQSGYFWIVKAPIQLSILINFIFFINILRVLCVKAKITRHIPSDARHIRKTAKFVLVLIPLFGVVYIVFSAYPSDVFGTEADVIYLYCEMFYNSFQGFLLALLFCFLNEEVQKELKRCLCKSRLNNFNTRSILLSSWRKSSRATSRDISKDSQLPSRDMFRDSNLTESCVHTHGNCFDTCKLSSSCEDLDTTTRKSREMFKGDVDLLMADPNVSNVNDNYI